jgi:hypothetical protein
MILLSFEILVIFEIKTTLKNLLFILLFIPLSLFSQETKIKNVLNIDTIKEEYIKTTNGITYFNGEPYTGVLFKNYENGQLYFEGNYIVKIGKALLGFHLNSITDIALQFLGDVRGYIIHIYCEFDENHMVQFLYK